MIPTINNKNPDVDPLESAAKQFAHWRSTRKKRGAIPEPLWALALSLRTQYGFTKIIKTLKLSGNDFKKRLNHGSAANNEKTIQFLDCSNQVFQATHSFETQSCSIEFSCKNASSVKLLGLNNIAIQQVLTLLIGHS